MLIFQFPFRSFIAHIRISWCFVNLAIESNCSIKNNSQSIQKSVEIQLSLFVFFFFPRHTLVEGKSIAFSNTYGVGVIVMWCELRHLPNLYSKWHNHETVNFYNIILPPSFSFQFSLNLKIKFILRIKKIKRIECLQ